MPAGYFVNVIAAGFGRMPSYASQIPPEDRWAIAVYVKVLQAAHGTALDALPEEARAEFELVMRLEGSEGIPGASVPDDGHGGSGGGASSGAPGAETR